MSGNFVRYILLACLSLLAPYVAAAGSDHATIDAFEALLSMPQTQPEDGEWGHRSPSGFDANSASEDDLIRFLARQRKAGADFNARRHFGTPLHHAIRGGLEETAVWLIGHGADPLLILDEGAGTSALSEGVQPDALGMAVEYRRWTVLEALLELDSVTAPDRSSQHRVAWQSALGESEYSTVDRLLHLRLPLPRDNDAAALLRVALERGWVALALAITEQGVTRPRNDVFGLPPPRPVQVDGNAVVLLDRRLTDPVLPYALNWQASAQELDVLMALPIRKPFGDTAFARNTMQRMLSGMVHETVVSEVQFAVLRRIPRIEIVNALGDIDLFGRWVRWAARLDSTAGEWALDVIGADLSTRSVDVVDAMLKNAGWFNENQQHPNLAGGWKRLLARLPTPLPVALNGKLWMFVPLDERPQLLQRGYHLSDDEIANWLDRYSADSIASLWPQLRQAMPELSRSIHRHLLKPFLVGAAYQCGWGGPRQNHLDIAQKLVADGARPEQPLTLDAECYANGDVQILSALQAIGMVAPAPAKQPDRFELANADCRFDADEYWREALLPNNDQDGIAIEGIQLIAVPGARDCGLLVWGGSTGGREYFYEEGFTGTTRFSPCVEGEQNVALWVKSDNRLRKTKLDEMPRTWGLLSMRDRESKRLYLIGGGVGQGTCGTQTPAELMYWDTTGRNPMLRALPRADPVMQAFLLVQCRGEAANSPCAAGDFTSDTLVTFVDSHWAAVRNRYLEAVLDLNYEALGPMRHRVFPHWTAQAILMVSRSERSIPEKRLRTAWLFRDPRLNEALTYESAMSLVPWLPIEDWTPVIKALSASGGMLDYLVSDAEREGRADLACRLSRAIGHACAVP